jgi:hypothetical protein
VTVVAAVLVISSWPDPDSFTIRVVIATAVQFGLIAAVAARLTPSASGTNHHVRRLVAGCAH